MVVGRISVTVVFAIVMLEISYKHVVVSNSIDRVCTVRGQLSSTYLCSISARVNPALLLISTFPAE